MRRAELALRPKYVAQGLVMYQLVRSIPSRSGADMYKTLDPHLPLVSFQTVQDLGFSIERILERARRNRVSVLPGRRNQRTEEERIERQAQAHLDARARQRDLPIRYDL